MELRASLKGALGERSQETLGASARESSGELSLNSPDAGSDTFNRDVALSMVANEQEALEEIEDAIDRIFDGTFGICQETQKPIKKPDSRLFHLLVSLWKGKQCTKKGTVKIGIREAGHLQRFLIPLWVWKNKSFAYLSSLELF